MANTDLSGGRVLSLDILRGFDLFALVFLQPLVRAVARASGWPWLETFCRNHLEHVAWEGFCAWDLVMPLFLFMAGVSLPFAHARFRAPGQGPALAARVARRVAALFLLGMVVQGNLLKFSLRELHFYSNTLQAIACGYLIATLILLAPSLKRRLAWTAGLLLASWALFTFGGDFTPDGNIAEKIDRLLLGSARDGVVWSADGTWSFSPRYRYTWIVSSLTFGVSVMLGAFAGEIVRAARAPGADKTRAAARLALTGAALLAAAWIWSFQTPIIKKIWTPSMTLWAGGLSFLLLALFYWWIDVKGRTRGLAWLRWYGANAILAYMVGEVVRFDSVSTSVFPTLPKLLGPWHAVWLDLFNGLVLLLLLRLLHRHHTHLKV